MSMDSLKIIITIMGISMIVGIGHQGPLIERALLGAILGLYYSFCTRLGPLSVLSFSDVQSPILVSAAGWLAYVASLTSRLWYMQIMPWRYAWGYVQYRWFPYFFLVYTYLGFFGLLGRAWGIWELVAAIKKEERRLLSDTASMLL